MRLLDVSLNFSGFIWPTQHTNSGKPLGKFFKTRAVLTWGIGLPRTTCH